MTFRNPAQPNNRKFSEQSQALNDRIIDASIVAFTHETPVIDDRWLIVLDPRVIELDDLAIRLTVMDLVSSDDGNQTGEAE